MKKFLAFAFVAIVLVTIILSGCSFLQDETTTTAVEYRPSPAPVQQNNTAEEKAWLRGFGPVIGAYLNITTDLEWFLMSYSPIEGYQILRGMEIAISELGSPPTDRTRQIADEFEACRKPVEVFFSALHNQDANAMQDANEQMNWLIENQVPSVLGTHVGLLAVDLGMEQEMMNWLPADWGDI